MNKLLTNTISELLDQLRDATDVGDLTDYVEDTDDVTVDAYAALIDIERVRHAQGFFTTFGLPITASLLYKALPDSYAAARGAQVLSLTGELVSTPARRVRQTAQFLITMLTAGPEDRRNGRRTSLHPGQPGALAARRLRVFHRGARDWVATYCTDRWNASEEYFKRVDPHGPSLGKPLNQEDLIGMLHGFTVGVFESLDVLGVPYSADDKEAWFHLWNVVGCHMGIGTEDAFEDDGVPAKIHAKCQFALPLDPSSSADTLAVIRKRHWMSSMEGSILVNALLADLSWDLPRALKPYPAALMRYLLGEETANLLGIARGGWVQQALLTANSCHRIGDIVRHRLRGAPVRLATSELSALVTQRALQAYVEQAEQGGPSFDLSSSLRNAWGIGSSREAELPVPPYAITGSTIV